MKKVKAIIIGASGYTGVELVRLLLNHPNVEIIALGGDSSAGKNLGELFPHLTNQELPQIQIISDLNFSKADVVFTCLPHGTTHEIAQNISSKVKIIDLSADFRISDIKTYEKWYNVKHSAGELQKKAVYGLTEFARKAVKKARLVACPGCYPTSVLLPLIPLLEKKLIKQSILIDSKSGISGAGRSSNISNLYTESNEAVKAYSVSNHRHIAEIEQSLNEASTTKITIEFITNLVPMNRGIISSIFVQGDYAKIRKQLEKTFEKETFVTVTKEGYQPSTKDVYATNNCFISIFKGRSAGQVIIISTIDNLIKGASGQAVQNMNVMFGIKEETSIEATPIFP
jgi:N-acetyl-gamma-glutamyl-phosphate reductase